MVESITPGGIKFTDKDLVGTEFRDAFFKGDYNPYNIHPFVIHDHGFVVCVVMASNLQDALDAAVDENKLDAYMIAEDELKDYTEDDISYLGNASEPFDLEPLEVEELETPEFSWCAMYNAYRRKELRSNEEIQS